MEIKKQTQSNSTILTFSFFLLFIINFLFMMSFTSINMVPKFLKESLNASKFYVGFFVNLPALELMLFVIIFGRYSNKIKKKELILIGFFLYIIFTLGMFYFHSNLYLLLLFRIVSSVSFAFAFTMIMSIAYQIIPEKKRGGGIAIFGLSGIISSPIGALIGEFLIHNYSGKYIFLSGVFFASCAAILLLFFKLPYHNVYGQTSKTIWNVIRNKKLFPFLYVALVFGGVFATFVSFIPNYSKSMLGISNLSLFFVPFSIVTIISRLSFSHFFNIITKKILINIGLFFSFMSMCLIVFLHLKWQMIIIGLLYGVGHSIMFPTLSSTFVDKARNKEKIIFNNTYLSANTFGMIFFPTFLGLIGDIFGTKIIFVIMIIFIISALFIINFIKEKKSVE